MGDHLDVGQDSIPFGRSEEHTSELQSHHDLVCRLLLEKKKSSPASFKRRSVDTSFVMAKRVSRLAVNNSCGSSAPNSLSCLSFFFFNDTATTEIYTLSLHDALPISDRGECREPAIGRGTPSHIKRTDRKSTRLNSSHITISYAVFCLKKKKNKTCQEKNTELQLKLNTNPY